MKPLTHLATFPHSRKIVTALVVRCNPNPDTIWLLMDADGNRYQRYADSCHVLKGALSEDLQALLEKIITITKSTYGRQVIQEASMRATIVERRGKVIRDELYPPPSAGRGSLPCYHEPLSMSQGMSSNLNKQMDRYLELGPLYRAQLDRLRDHNPRYYEVYIRHMHEGMKLADIGRLLGISEAAAKMAKHRAHNYLLEGMRHFTEEGV